MQTESVDLVSVLRFLAANTTALAIRPALAEAADEIERLRKSRNRIAEREQCFLEHAENLRLALLEPRLLTDDEREAVSMAAMDADLRCNYQRSETLRGLIARLSP